MSNVLVSGADLPHGPTSVRVDSLGSAHPAGGRPTHDARPDAGDRRGSGQADDPPLVDGEAAGELMGCYVNRTARSSRTRETRKHVNSSGLHLSVGHLGHQTRAEPCHAAYRYASREWRCRAHQPLACSIPRSARRHHPRRSGLRSVLGLQPGPGRTTGQIHGSRVLSHGPALPPRPCRRHPTIGVRVVYGVLVVTATEGMDSMTTAKDEERRIDVYAACMNSSDYDVFGSGHRLLSEMELA
jgi:hypothetical protein